MAEDRNVQHDLFYGVGQLYRAVAEDYTPLGEIVKEGSSQDCRSCCRIALPEFREKPYQSVPHRVSCWTLQLIWQASSMGLLPSLNLYDAIDSIRDGLMEEGLLSLAWEKTFPWSLS